MTEFSDDPHTTTPQPASGNRVLLVEDEPIYSEQLELLLRSLDYEPVGPVATAQAALALYRTEPPVDLVLLDIGLRGPLDGIQLAEMLLAQAPVPLIFLTSFVDELTFRRAQEIGPAAYLLKPIDSEALKRAIVLAVKNFARASWPAGPPAAPAGPGVIYVKENGLLEKVHLSDILCLQADNKTCTIVLAERSLTVHMPLRELARALPGGQFVQIQRSYFINLAYLERIDPTRHLVQLGRQVLPIGRLYLPGLYNRQNQSCIRTKSILYQS